MSDDATTDGVVHDVAEALEKPPEPPPSGPMVWMRENLFGGDTPLTIGFNAFLTISFALITVFGVRFITGYLFAPERRWAAVTHNMKLMMVQAFPQDDLGRIWLSIGIFLVLGAWTLTAWDAGGRMTVHKLGTGLRGGGIFVLFLVVLHPANPPSSSRLIIGALGLIFGVAGILILRRYGAAAKEKDFPFPLVMGVGMVLVVGSLWFVQLPVPTDTFEEGLGPIATTTSRSWSILVAVTIVAYLVGPMLQRALGDRFKRYLTIGWIASYPIIIMVIQRNPILDFQDLLGFGETPFVSSALGTTLLAIVVGGALMWWLAAPNTGEEVRIFGFAAVIAGIAVFFFPMPFLYRVLILSFALVAAAAPSFGGTKAGQRRMVVIWITIAILTVVAFVLGRAETALFFQGTTFLGGFNLTILLAITGLVFSFPLGVVLALARTSSMPIFRLISTGYIEIVRSVPLITWLFFGSVMLALFLPQGVSFDEILRIVGAISIFSAAYVAENVRGGLQSIGKGQYEASRAMGLSTVQSTSLIILPQAIRAVIPALVGSIIVAFKDTSLVAIIGLADVLLIARSFVPGQTAPFNFLGTQQQMIFFIALFYWVFTFTFSRMSLKYEERIGLGQR